MPYASPYIIGVLKLTIESFSPNIIVPPFIPIEFVPFALMLTLSLTYNVPLFFIPFDESALIVIFEFDI